MVSPTCALLGGFAIGSRVSFLWQRMYLMRSVSKDVIVQNLSDRDWEDMKKMPEHQTLVKDFKKIKYSLVFYLCLIGCFNILHNDIVASIMIRD